MAAQKRVDYERIEPGWRAGILSPHQLAAAYTAETGDKVSHTAIIKHFRKQGVLRDLKAKIQAKADEIVNRSMVTRPVTPETIAQDNALVEDGGKVLAAVRISHRQDINKAKTILMRMFEELEHQTGLENAELLSRLGELMDKSDGEAADKLNEVYQKVISLPSRAKTMKDLGDTLRGLIAVDREAYGLDEKKSNTAPGDISITF